MKDFRALRISLGSLQIFIALGAIAGGATFLLDRSGGIFGFTLDLLRGTPFNDFLIPGLFLLLINGVGTLAAGIFTLRIHSLAAEMAVAFGALLMGWIAAQILWLGYLSWMQPFYFVLGALEFVLGAWLWNSIRRRV